MVKMYQYRLPEHDPRKWKDHNTLETPTFHLTTEERKYTVGEKKKPQKCWPYTLQLVPHY